MGTANPDPRTVRKLRRLLSIPEDVDDLPTLGEAVEDQLTEAQIAYAYRNAPRRPRKARSGPEVPEPTIRPIDWDLAVGEPLAAGRGEPA
jgi:hypothetical protein